MPDDVVVSMRGVSKKFCRNLRRSMAYGIVDLARTLAGLETKGNELRKGEFWGLDDVSFDVKRGEAIGIIGPNGAGKTTLLRMLTGIFPPDKGFIAVRGHITGLIALGLGMHPHMTGRENVYLNGAILGMSQERIREKFDSIVEFAELGDFIDAPFSSYSSGMKVRLGFAVAIAIKPDILVIDEVLSVGDQRFRRKARNAMAKLLESNTALIFISHNMHEVLGITQRAIWLDRGRIVKQGDSPSVCTEYLYHAQNDRKLIADLPFDYMDKRTGDLAVSDAHCHVGEKQAGRRVVLDGPDTKLVIDMILTARNQINEVLLHCISVATPDGTQVGYTVINEALHASAGTRLERRIVLSTDCLQPGAYQIGYEIGTEGGPLLEGIRNLLYFDVKPRTWLMSPRLQEGLNYARMAGNPRGAVLLPVSIHKTADDRGRSTSTGPAQ